MSNSLIMIRKDCYEMHRLQWLWIAENPDVPRGMHPLFCGKDSIVLAIGKVQTFCFLCYTHQHPTKAISLCEECPLKHCNRADSLFTEFRFAYRQGYYDRVTVAAKKIAHIVDKPLLTMPSYPLHPKLPPKLRKKVLNETLLISAIQKNWGPYKFIGREGEACLCKRHNTMFDRLTEVCPYCYEESSY